MKYQFSAPMPYQAENIDKVLDLNKEVEKSAITSLYASLPTSCSLFTGFEQTRNFLYEQDDFEYWKKLFAHCLEKNSDFIYLLNSPRPFDLMNPNFEKSLEKLDKLLQEFTKIGVNKLRIANPQLISYIHKHYKDFTIYASTSLEYKTISEYQNLLMLHREVKQIVPSHDINKNFKLLKNIRKEYPNIEMELIVNEGCMQGCPHRNMHASIDYDDKVKDNEDFTLSCIYCRKLCSLIARRYPFHSLTLNNNIFPWDLEEYAKIGINKFKFVGRETFQSWQNIFLEGFLLYMKAIEDFKYVEDRRIIAFINHLKSSMELSELSAKEVRPLLPKMSHFKKYGHLCASQCGVECRYCYDCAKKIQNYFEKKMKKQQNKLDSICKIS